MNVFWHWPDHTIGKRESRRLREEHNKLANAHAELVTAAQIARTTLETVFRERDPQNIAAKCAAERLGKLLP